MAAVVATGVTETHLEAASIIVPGAVPPVVVSSAAAAAAAEEDDNNIPPPPAAAGGPVWSAAVDAPAAGDGPSTSVIESDSEARNHFISSSSYGPSIWQLLAGLLGLTAVVSSA